MPKHVTLKPSKAPPKTMEHKKPEEVEAPKVASVSKIKEGQKPKDVVRGATDIPLSTYGMEQAVELAKKTEGCFTRIICSPLLRARQTAEAIQNSNRDEVPWIELVEPLTTWFMGERFEGKLSASVEKEVDDVIRNHPDKAISGRGPESAHDGQSFDEFKICFLRFLLYLIDAYKDDPREKLLCISHFRNIRTVEAWVKAGAMGNMDVDIDVMTAKPKPEEGPGDLFLFDPLARTLKRVDNAKEKGIYFARHGSTEFNQENNGDPSVNVVEPDEKK